MVYIATTMQKEIQPEDQWSRKRSTDYFPCITTTVKREKGAKSIFRCSSGLWPNFELIQALMYVIVTCKNEKDLIRIAEKKWQHHFSPL